MNLLDDYWYQQNMLYSYISSDISRISRGNGQIGLNVVTSNDELNVSKLIPEVDLFPSLWMNINQPTVSYKGFNFKDYRFDINGVLCDLHTPENGIPTRASINYNKTINDIVSDGTYNPADDNNIRNICPSELSVLKNKILSDILGYDPRRVYLNLTPPEGGEIRLCRIRTAPDRDFEYSLDGFIWHTWENDPDFVPTESVPDLRKIILEAGQTLFVRNASATTVSLATNTTNFYEFRVPDGTALYGILESMVNKNPFNGSFYNAGIAGLFYNCMLTGHPVSISPTIGYQCMRMVFYNTTQYGTGTLTRITLHATTLTDVNNSMWSWLYNAPAGGVLTCPKELQLASSSSGLPTNWTRENLYGYE